MTPPTPSTDASLPAGGELAHGPGGTCLAMTSTIKACRIGRILVTLGLALLLSSAALAIDPLPFENPAEEARFRALAAELRCVMCQNQSLADSSAMIAQDLRREVFELMREGRSDDEIKHFLVERYGEFVLYKPPMRGRTVLLWFGPLLVLLGGAVAVFVIVRKRAASAPPVPPASGEDW